MNIVKLFFHNLIFVLALLGHAGPSYGTESLRLESVTLSRKEFSPETGGPLVITFTPSRPAQSLLTIYDRLGGPIRTFENAASEEGARTVRWDGRDENGREVAAGVYYYTITLKDGPETWTHNPYKETHGKVLHNSTAYYDGKKGLVKLTLAQAAMVRIRVNIKNGGPIVATPLDWTPLPAGEHEIPWNGYDADGAFDASGRPDRRLMLYVYSLADNSIIVKTDQRAQDGVFTPLGRKELAARPFALDLPGDRHAHARKDPRLSRVARISVEFPGNEKTNNGLPVVSGSAPVRVAIDPRDQWIIENSRYELMFFIDGTVLFEDESAFAPFTYYFNTNGITEGEHVLTVNVLSYDDEYATVSRRIYVK